MSKDGMFYFSEDDDYPGKHDELPGGGPTDEDLEKFISPNEMKKMRDIENRVLRDFGGSDTPDHINRGQFGFRFKDWSNNTDNIEDDEEDYDGHIGRRNPGGPAATPEDPPATSTDSDDPDEFWKYN